MGSTDEDTRKKRSISPPVIKRKKQRTQGILHASQPDSTPKPTPASVEAGSAVIPDHLAFYTSHLSSAIRSEHSRLLIQSWQDLYTRNLNAEGRHFVIHQHDHPQAGTHYDLRLQINETSSCSWAIMYGLPGNPNSTHLNRNATETRVHCLWNHLIESGSRTTGSLLIWDTGEYEVVPAAMKQDLDLTDEESQIPNQADFSEQHKLATAFARGKIRLKLHGSRLPKDYVLYIRRPKDANLIDRRPSRQRRRQKVDMTSGGHSDSGGASAHSDEVQDEAIRKNNAYPGATNTIGSIHQRTWYASMDRVLSGYCKVRSEGRYVWIKRPSSGHVSGPSNNSDPDDGATGIFFVRGRDHERSVVTGRLAADIMHDEGVVGYNPRPGWRPILE